MVSQQHCMSSYICFHSSRSLPTYDKIGLLTFLPTSWTSHALSLYYILACEINKLSPFYFPLLQNAFPCILTIFLLFFFLLIYRCTYFKMVLWKFPVLQYFLPIYDFSHFLNDHFWWMEVLNVKVVWFINLFFPCYYFL